MFVQSKRRFERDCKEAERAQHICNRIDLDNKTDGEKVDTFTLEAGAEMIACALIPVANINFLFFGFTFLSDFPKRSLVELS